MTIASRHSTVLHLREASRKEPRALVHTYAFDVQRALSGWRTLPLGAFAVSAGFGLAFLINPLLPF